MEMPKKYTISEFALFFYVYSVITVSFNPTYFFVSNLLGVSLILVYLFEAYKNNHFFVRIFIFPHFLFFWFLIFCLISLTYSPEGYSRLITLFQLFLLSLVITNLIGYSGRVWPIVYGTFVGLGYAGFKGLLEFSNNSFFNSNIRMASTLENANIFAFALLLGVVFSVLNILKVDRDSENRKKVLFFNVLLLVFFGYQIIAFTGSRKGILLFCLATLLVYIYFLKNANFSQKLLLVFFGIAQNIFLLLFIKGSAHYQRMEALYSYGFEGGVKDNSINTRASMMLDALELWYQKPLLGWGVDQFKLISNYGVYSHSNMTEILVNNGVVGFILYYGMYVYLIFLAFGFVRSETFLFKNIGFWIFMVVLLMLLFDFAAVTYYMKLNWILLSTVFGITYHFSEKISNIKSEENMVEA